MNCGAARKDLYRLGELVHQAAAMPIPAEMAEAQAHLMGCAACSEFFSAEERIKALLRHRAPRPRASAALRERVLNRIAAVRVQPERQAIRVWSMGRHGMALTAAGLLILTLVSGLWLGYLRTRVMPQELASILIDDHARNLAGTVEIASSDQNVVQAWFRGKLNFSFRLPPTRDPSLVGGRICDLKGRTAALVFYQHPQSRVSLFILDGSKTELPEDRLIPLDGRRCLVDSMKGYTVVPWKERGLVYGLVSDMRSADLLQMAERF